MGLKLSCIHRGSNSIARQVHHQPARVITGDGSLKELPASSPPRVSDVLPAIHNADAAAPPLFVCNSDALYFNEHPPALYPGDLLRPGQIYFVLPVAMLEKPLSTADMAALAAAASRAAPPCLWRRQEEGRDEDGGEDVFFNEKLNQQTLGEFGVVSPSPAKREGKLTAAAAATTSRMKRALSIIQEDAE
ncbi:hypothetical protein HU200_006188 [Digitaria exilis]|uniref:DUF4228 domain-containing protein n=1 Tax=Digitaria exilis TaxID=1010633 RepID=A0A835KTF4_9POAL|nr:hypothetical protein HU200_006188 [Digitaria exilis]